MAEKVGWVAMLDVAARVKGIQRALSYGRNTHSPLDVLDCVEKGEAQLWLEPNATIVTQIFEHPNEQVLHFWLAAGELESVLELSDKVLEWGKSEGCTRATLSGRKGWARALEHRGWSDTKLVTMERSLI